MFGQTLIGADYTAYFNFDTLVGTTVCVGLIILAAAIVACITVYFAKRDKFRYAVLGCFATIFVYAIIVTIINLVEAAGTTVFEEGHAGLVASGEAYPWIIAAVTIVLFAALVALTVLTDRKKLTSRAHTMSVVYAAISIALSFGLSYVKFFDAPYGGSITMFSLLPIALYSYMFGVKRGAMAGFIYGLLQTLQNPWIVHPIQYLLDYVFPFAIFGACAGLFRNMFASKNIDPRFKDGIAMTCGIALGVIARFICHFIAGAVYFEVYMPTSFTNVWWYSFVYQCTYVPIDGIICAAGAVMLMASAYFRKLVYDTVAKFEKGVASAKNNDVPTVSVAVGADDNESNADSVADGAEKSDKTE